MNNLKDKNIISTLDLEPEFRSLLEEEFPGANFLHLQLNELSDEELAQVHIVLTFGYDINSEVVNKMSSLEWLQIGQSGIDPLPLDLLKDKGVFVTNSRGINSSIISEYVLGAMLNVVRDSFTYAERASRKVWDSKLTVEELAGKTVGVFGVGSIGKEVAKRAKAFDMRVLGVNLYTSEASDVDEMFLPEDKFEVLPQCDFVVLSLPLLASTNGLIDKQALASMKPSAWLINVGRGQLVDYDALLEAIDDQQIAGAVLDVFEVEPLPSDSSLWNRANIWITPHTAGDHFSQYSPRMVEIFRHNLEKYPQYDQMINPVPSYYYEQYKRVK